MKQLLRSAYYLAVIIATVLATHAYFDSQNKAVHPGAFEETLADVR